MNTEGLVDMSHEFLRQGQNLAHTFAPTIKWLHSYEPVHSRDDRVEGLKKFHKRKGLGNSTKAEQWELENDAHTCGAIAKQALTLWELV